MSVKIEHEGNTYEFHKNEKGIGSWVPVTGRNKYVKVSLVLSTTLRKKAIDNGTSPDVFNGPKKKLREKRVSVKTRSSKKSGRFSVSLSSVLKTARKFSEDDNEETD